MATRNDVNTDYQPSPRVVEVVSPSTELSVQDLVDTLRESEESFSEGLSFDKLIDASGKENLGGGVLVGITAVFKTLKYRLRQEQRPQKRELLPRVVALV